MELSELDADTSHLRERLLGSEQAFRGRFLDVRRDRVGLPDGSTSQREYIVHPGAVMVVPLLDEAGDRVVVERQWRHPMGRAMLEFPAGKLEAGEAAIDCAERELTEETGHRAAEWARAGILHNAIAYSTEGIEVWFARGLDAGERRLDAGEFLDVAETAVEALFAAAADGTLTDAKSLAGLLWLQNWRLGHWPLVWRDATAWRLQHAAASDASPGPSIGRPG